VDVFARAICMGSLATFPPGYQSAAYIYHLLAIASLLFVASLFFAFGILYLMRNEVRDRAPSRRRRLTGTLQYFVAFMLMLAGFVVPNVIIIAIGEPLVGYFGIALIGSVPFWVIFMAQDDRSGWLEDEEEQPSLGETGELHSPTFSSVTKLR